MKILITGATGQLGTQLCEIIRAGKSELGEIPSEYKNADVIATDINSTECLNLDITDKQQVDKILNKFKPDILINCSAYTNVDGCETDSLMAFKVNSLGVRNLAIACEQVGTKLVHISTDYVFSGIGNTPFCEYDVPNPQSVYGKTKLQGEEYLKTFCKKHFIIRTAWLYGYNGANFVKTIMRVAKQNGTLKVVNDQIGNPTNAVDLAHHILLVANTQEYGTYHCTGEGICSWFDFATKIVELAKIDAEVLPCTTQEFPRPAKRPEYSALENGMLKATVGNYMRGWQQALECFFENYTQQ